MAICHSGNSAPRKQRRRRPPIIRFLEKVRVNPERVFEGTPCWEWSGARNQYHYGRIGESSEMYAHRLSYVLFIGIIPEGLEIDHKCTNRCCVSPFHLQAVTKQINQALRAVARRHCPKGHPFDEANTYSRPNQSGRTCKKCRYEAIKRWRAKHPEEAREVYRRDKAQWRAKGGF
jgi:hypothetical protein